MVLSNLGIFTLNFWKRMLTNHDHLNEGGAFGGRGFFQHTVRAIVQGVREGLGTRDHQTKKKRKKRDEPLCTSPERKKELHGPRARVHGFGGRKRAGTRLEGEKRGQVR